VFIYTTLSFPVIICYQGTLIFPHWVLKRKRQPFKWRQSGSQLAMLWFQISLQCDLNVISVRKALRTDEAILKAISRRMLLHYNHGEEDELSFQMEKSSGKTYVTLFGTLCTWVAAGKRSKRSTPVKHRL